MPVWRSPVSVKGWAVAQTISEERDERGVSPTSIPARIKNYVREAGSSRVRNLLASFEFLSSAITPIELQSAIRRRHRQREITQPTYNAIISQIGNDRLYWQLVEVVPLVLRRAEELIMTDNVRTLDVIHLASALIIEESIPGRLAFISTDEKQLAAAHNCNLRVTATA